MHIHYLQHVPFEDLASLGPALLAMGHTLSHTRLYAGDPLPASDRFDALIVMGGPMGVHDEAIHPWLATEKSLIRQVIEQTVKPVLGICLGAQLIADALGATVSANPCREIGWFPLDLDAAFSASRWGGYLVAGEPVFHWHGDTFALPAGALAIGSSAACATQGYIVEDRVVGLQFHLETTLESATALIAACGDELDGSAYVQSAGEMLANPERFTRINRAAAGFVGEWLKSAS